MTDYVSRAVTRVSTVDGSADLYDHEISLIDTTEPPEQDLPQPSSASAISSKLSKVPSRTGVTDYIARRKYAKWQEDRFKSKAPSAATTERQVPKAGSKQGKDAEQQAATGAIDFAENQSVDRGRKNADKRRRESKHLKHQIHEIDILYENQRGSFFCGIPLYSHSSLLPTDPSPWVNKHFHDSPVNITNAQVPDPSWEWAWKTWYVDMSYDVDEEGWQYSFAFGRNFAWHGTHPWFHSFVRRRRWLRKRVKRNGTGGRDKPGGLNAAHHLTQDYFTIHSTRERSPVSTVDGAARTARPASYMSQSSPVDMLEQPPEDIKDIASLLKALRFASVDREKIEVVRKFVDQAGEELVYLKDHIPDIMSFLVFQNSRTQLLAYLKRTANDARKHREHHEDEKKPEGDIESRRIDNLLAAVDTANAQVGGLEYWSDRKHVLQTADENALETRALATIFDAPPPKPRAEDDVVKDIKGISEEADLKGTKIPSIFRRSGQNKQATQQETEKEDKGKSKAVHHDSEDDRMEADPSPRLRPDEVLIPGDD
ncbi:hypothetical protein LTR10_016944 [Elasticomyces elasticus]|uniref:Peroxin/Ferlin domain-containing protein n=1 Tax=Exophiala sideris TaxID=1016849 RepID=A0ABR0JFH5_9EURO|nr:hypothetical protein LTR10_016944 [Elasticomyces elasticus]KAK5025198.1 hypothetical protein LTS07_008049 [Exophiala sideris]KAK5029254.1 hypothetical protein LTR13_008791 [Exophiala sideris]KAK5063257.1 hypothetical protein LTR69_003963 [Exophiala sideris]KAK5178973.1 hypothetical protein LTR44_008462 [Eurotiomycetes sp. CCFEE 6388]